MGEIQKQLWHWIAKLLPKQKNEGAGAVQVGSAGRDVVSNVTMNIVNIHGQFTNTRPASVANPAQREVLTMIRRLRKAEPVFLFMEREFGTRMVIELQPTQLLRLKRYVEAIHRRTKGKST